MRRKTLVRHRGDWWSPTLRRVIEMPMAARWVCGAAIKCGPVRRVTVGGYAATKRVARVQRSGTRGSGASAHRWPRVSLRCTRAARAAMLGGLHGACNPSIEDARDDYLVRHTEATGRRRAFVESGHCSLAVIERRVGSACGAAEHRRAERTRPRRGAGHGWPALASGDRMSTLASPAPTEKRRGPGVGRSPAHGGATRGALSLGYFSLGKQREVTRARARKLRRRA